MAAPIAIPITETRTRRIDEIEASCHSSGSSCSGSGTNSPVFFGRTSPGSYAAPKTSIAAVKGPPSPSTIKKLLRIRKMSEMVTNPESGNIITIPTQVKDISPGWVKIIINQYKIKHVQPPLSIKAEVINMKVDDCKVSSGDMSTTCKIHADVDTHGQLENYTFIAKILPADDPNRVYVFEANVFEKEISIYFELLPCMRQFCLDSPLHSFLSSNIPQCIYGSNNTDGAGVLVFECALQQGYSHPVDPEGLSLEQVLCAVNFMAKFHAIGSALISKKLKSIQLRHPYLLNNVYGSPMMIEGAKKIFDLYAEFLSYVPDQKDLVEKFNKHCQGESGVTQMFSCMRRQVTSPFNTIVHGEFWEKNILFREEDHTLQCVILDWKNAKIASATKDIAFFLLSSTTNKIRTEFLDTILDSYFSTFCDALKHLNPELLQDPSLSFDHFYDDYKMSTKGAFMQSVCVLIQEMQHLESLLSPPGKPSGERKSSCGNIGETLRIYERRALNLMNDKVLNEKHFV